MKVVDWNQHKQKWPHLRGINFPQTGKRPIVDLLIGVDQSDLHCSLRDVPGGPGEPIARLTPLGWSCIGNPQVDPPGSRPSQTLFTFFQSSEQNLGEIVRRFWELEEPPSSTNVIVRQEEKMAQKAVTESLSYKDGHYCVGMPWKQDKPQLPDNYDMAVHRLLNTEKRLLRCPDVAEAYDNTLSAYERKGYIRQVSPHENKTSEIWYLPHFPVLRPDKATTKTRIVFDASAKYQNLSLNDTVHQGPKLQNSLFAVLTRFRRESVALMCDVQEMYLQIELKPEEKPYMRFLWRQLDQKRKPDVYEFNRIVFGMNCSPFQAQFVTRYHAEQHQRSHPRAAETVLKSTYMDDSMDSVSDVTSCIDLYKDLSELWPWPECMLENGYLIRLKC